MSTLQDFVNQQKAKGTLGTPSSFSASFSSFGDLKSKLSSSISESLSGIPLISRSSTVDVDSESLTSPDDASTSGQLLSSRNRKFMNGWFGGLSGNGADDGACG
ncbi:unnamed protein product [Anisakis simplex]|uniref:Uncharacterized protein n=1 Tax=Anisakis simplex TaxID=6269 RepID=A0A0M3J3Q4_ANISI|nr:unnamed protein product [Anisakis simplex]